MNQIELIHLMRSVFPHRMDTPLPIVRADTYRDDEVIALEREFAGVEDWTALSADFVDQAPGGWSSALAFLSDEAVCFFLPAFLVADLAGKLTRADPVFALAYGLDGSHGNTHAKRGFTNEQQAQERWRRLDQAQCSAVVAYLHLSLSSYAVDDLIEAALARYWRPRAHGLTPAGGSNRTAPAPSRR